MNADKNSKSETTVLGGGCFWCLETVYLHTRGVISVMSGYAGGSTENPTYEEVSSGKTGPTSTRGDSSTRGGHAEVVKINFDPDVISFGDILGIFFSLHDPTTLNRQGNDIGAEYRSIILYANDGQKQEAEKIIKELTEEKIFKDKIVTEIAPLRKFWPAEEYQQRYFEKNPNKAYCQIIVAPKLAKFRQKYSQYYQ